MLLLLTNNDAVAILIYEISASNLRLPFLHGEIKMCACVVCHGPQLDCTHWRGGGGLPKRPPSSLLVNDSGEMAIRTGITQSCNLRRLTLVEIVGVTL